MAKLALIKSINGKFNLMSRDFEKLNPEELDLLNRAPMLVSILIAGADGTIDKNEIKGAIETAKKKSKGKSSLQAFYDEVATDFEDKLKVILQNYPNSPDERCQKITTELSQLNGIFKKISGTLAVNIYESLKSLAMNIAKSSGGGIFGFNPIGPEEAKYVDLNMISPPSP